MYPLLLRERQSVGAACARPVSHRDGCPLATVRAALGLNQPSRHPGACAGRPYRLAVMVEWLGRRAYSIAIESVRGPTALETFKATQLDMNAVDSTCPVLV